MDSRERSYDYIVVGGGSAGCVLAARLSAQENVSVLLVEAGPRRTAAADALPGEWPGQLATDAVYQDSTVVQKSTGSPVHLPHGKGIGGSSTVNAMGWVRGTPASYDAWAESGARGWAYADLLPYLRRSEHAPGRDGTVRGVGGPMVVAPLPEAERSGLGLAVQQAVAEAGHRVIADPSSGLSEGIGWFDLTIRDGRRLSVADAYLTPVLDRPNLTVVTDTVVQRLIVHDGRCTRVEYRGGDGLVSVGADREVILAAGAIGSAQLLLVSGIGPADHLDAVGVTTVHHLPGVGAGLQDHPITGVVYSSPQPVSFSPRGNVNGPCGLLRSDPSLESPDLHLLTLEEPFDSGGAATPEHGYTLGVALVRPRSRGTLRLAEPDISTPPLIDPNYLDDPRDLEALTNGLRQVRRIGQAGALEPWRGREVVGPEGDALDAIEAYVRSHLTTYFHPMSTCRIGNDDMAVVDARLKVRGLDGLRVADASVIPSAIAGMLNSTVVAIAERASDLIVGSERG